LYPAGYAYGEMGHYVEIRGHTLGSCASNFVELCGHFVEPCGHILWSLVDIFCGALWTYFVELCGHIL